MRWIGMHAARAALAAVLVSLTATTWATAQVEDLGPLPTLPDDSRPIIGCGKGQALAARFLAGLPPYDAELDAADREALGATDVLHYTLDIEILPSSSHISGTNTITVRSLIDGLTQFTIRLQNQYACSAVINGSTPVTVTTSSSSTRVVTLDRAYDAGEIFTLTITYSGTASAGGFGSINFQTQNGQPLVFSLSEPYYAYTWWPVKDGDAGLPGDNGDKATVELAVTAPSTLRTVSNGLLQGIDTLSGNRKRYRWATNYPIATYLVFFSTTNYNTWTQTYDYGAGTMPVEFNIYPASDTTSNRTAWEKCLSALAVYRTIFGLYPFINEKYGIYQFAFGGGMEHQTNTGQGTFSESVTVHELSHQWWGDNITCKTWNDIWLNEGFADYAEALWYERKPGSTGLPALFTAMANRRPSTVNGSVYCYDTTDVNRIFSTDFTYYKGGWVLHQLRHVLGDDAFFNLLATYRAAFEGSAATTGDFAALASQAYGQDLSWFFNEWVYGTGAPAYATGWQNVNISGQSYLRLRVRQTQSSGYGTYTMPIDVRVNFASGNQTYKIFNNAATQYFLIPITASATSIVLDENAWILTTSKTSETYVNGPAKIVQTSPLPGAVVPLAGAPSAVTVTFSESVTPAVTDFVLTSSRGTVPFTLSYSATNFTATLNCGAPLPGGAYTLTVKDSLRTAVASIQLDGEIASPASPASLPSGNGLAGGNAVIPFVIPPVGDLNSDGSVNSADLALFAPCLAGPDVFTPPAGCDATTFAAADLEHDGDVDVADFATFQALVGGV
jgi:aminopeptidase N